MSRFPFDRRLVLAVLPALIVFAVFEAFLGHRHDYSGHYAAGYGGTLGALMVWLKMVPVERFPRLGLVSILPVCVACILLGAVAEATVFRLAKFDEIDFFNQSLGAVLAGIVAMAFTGQTRPPRIAFDQGLIAAIAFLGLGGVFSVA